MPLRNILDPKRILFIGIFFQTFEYFAKTSDFSVMRVNGDARGSQVIHVLRDNDGGHVGHAGKRASRSVFKKLLQCGPIHQRFMWGQRSCSIRMNAIPVPDFGQWQFLCRLLISLDGLDLSQSDVTIRSIGYSVKLQGFLLSFVEVGCLQGEFFPCPIYRQTIIVQTMNTSLEKCSTNGKAGFSAHVQTF